MTHSLQRIIARGAEREADGDAIAMLARAGIDRRKIKQAFDRFRALEMGLPAWASSHPPSAARGARFAASPMSPPRSIARRAARPTPRR